MGRSIVYCDKCGQLLKEDDFRLGKASTADNRSFCATCRPTSTALPKLPPAAKVSTSRIPKQPSARIGSVSPPGGATPSVPPAPAPAANTKMLVIGGILGVVVIGLAFAMMSGGKPESRKPEETNTTQSVVAFHPPPPVDKSSPEERQLEEAARAACVKAYGIKSTRPTDLAGQWRAFEEAVAVSRGSSYYGDASNQLEKLRRRFAEEREALETRTQDAMSRDQLKTALGIWEAEQRRYDVAEWTKPAAARIEELRAEADRRFTVALEAASEAKRRGDENEAKNIRNKVAGWGLPGYAEKVDQALAAIVPDKPKPPAEDPDKAAKAREGYVNRWKEMLAPAAAREYGEAVKLLEKLLAETTDEQLKKDCARDLENVKLAAAFVAEAAPLLSKVPKGTKLPWTFTDPAGGLVRLDDVVLKIDATRVEVKWEDASRVIPFGEVGAATLNELTKGKSAKAAAVACALEGDEEAAKKLGGIPDYYAVLGREAAEARARDERESRARAQFYEAERDYFDASESSAAVLKYKTLLGELGTTVFVRRNKAAIAARTESGARDLLIPAADLLSTAGFKLGKYAKVDAAWVSQADLDVPKMKENFIEFNFPAAGADVEHRLWILAGGCCQEVLGCYAQGTELVGPDPTNPREKAPLEPGANAGLFVKPTGYSLKKLHSQHTGPKNPERFDWVQVVAMKFTAPGLKKFRILTNQKGFAVAAAAVLVTRPGPPRDSDFKALEAWKAETPGAVPNRAVVAGGSILREIWRGVGGGGLGDLANHQAYKDDRPSETSTTPSFEILPGLGTDYGARLRGWIHPPLSGLYVFWITSDDQGDLKLSPDEDPKNQRSIASVPEWCGVRDFTKHAAQQSQPIELKAGRRYYIEAVLKQGAGGDHLTVKWRMPNGVEELPIPGTRLSPWRK